jgi:hypothetical protein
MPPNRAFRPLPGWKHSESENIMERRHFLHIGTGAALGSMLAGCGGGGGRSGHHEPPGEPAQAKVTPGWTMLVLDAVRVNRSPPPMASRSMALMHTAMYDAWAAYDPVAVGTCHGAGLRRPLAEHTPANQARAISYAAYAVLRDQFPAQLAVFDAHMATLGYAPADASTDGATPQGVGSLAAAAIIARAHVDGANQLGKLSPSGMPFADYTGYLARNAPMVVAAPTPRSAIAAPDRWQPLITTDATGVLRTQSYLLPFWGKVQPFALPSGAHYRPLAAAVFGTSAFVEQARQVVAAQAALTDTHKAMAHFWAGGNTGELPPGYWTRFALLTSARDRHTEAADIKLFFALSNALFDAGVTAWDAKRAYDSARPITAIRYLFSGTTIRAYGLGGPAAGLRDIDGNSWMPYHLPSVPLLSFPDHVSGHSTYSMAAAVVLRLFTGSDTFNHQVTIDAGSLAFAPTTPANPVTLSWPTYTAAALEAGVSRMYAGIHFEAADSMGRTLGERVGKAVLAKAQHYWLGAT